MSKHVIVYKPNSLGRIEKIETIDGEVVNEGHEHESGSFASRAWAWFFSGRHNQTVGGNAWEKKYKNPTDGNGREFNPETGDLEYTTEAPNKGYAEPASDYQGSVPSWDGYSGES